MIFNNRSYAILNVGCNAWAPPAGEKRLSQLDLNNPGWTFVQMGNGAERANTHGRRVRQCVGMHALRSPRPRCDQAVVPQCLFRPEAQSFCRMLLGFRSTKLPCKAWPASSKSKVAP